MATRTQGLAPWYWLVFPRCTMLIVSGDKHRCKFSARYEERGRPETTVCKIHKDMLVIQENKKFTEIVPRVVDLSALEE